MLKYSREKRFLRFATKGHAPFTMTVEFDKTIQTKRLNVYDRRHYCTMMPTQYQNVDTAIL